MKHIKNIDEITIESFIVDSQQIVSTGKPKFNIEEPPFIGPDGKYSYWLANKVPLCDRYDNIYGVIRIYTDITEQKKLEYELALAKEKAEIANQTKSQFIAIMNHDLRTPLTGLLGAAQYIQRYAENYIIRNEAQSLINCTTELLNLFNEIINLIQIESGKIIQLEIKFSLIDLIHRTLDLYKPAAKQKNYFYTLILTKIFLLC